MTRNLLADNELWDKIKLGDSKAFDLLFERYWSAIYSTAFIYLKDQETCKEIVNDIFLNIWQKRHVLEINSFKAYLTTAARYHVYKVVKKEKLSPIQLIENYSEIPESKNSINLGEEKILYQEMENDIDSVLNTLPQRCREIFVMSRINHLSNQEIADQLGISKRTVENQLTHALKILRFSLKAMIFSMLFFHI